ncbi:interleukin 2 receptor, gamma a isoform X1 [Ictalurus punctatus]|uniref:Interleukin 2 receptor, gamma a isoform X1 n=1 Tax=Ictalurus punctatus TaxID=7998 RepID=A0A2D0SPR6_ICTPU|nr:interleukin 2 receptor, gamma a isoform X1 [Ictalurus punctatus]
MFLSSFLSFVWISSGSASTLPHQIECMVVNVEYVICTWDKDGTLAENYTFMSSYKNPDDPAECSSYQYSREVRVGCVVPYSEKELQRFKDFYAWLYRDNNIIAKQEYKSLINREIECTVVNLEYMICTWDKDDEDRTLAENYTFKSSYKKSDDPAECSSYQYSREVRVGCVVPYSEKDLQRFDHFYAWLYRDNNIAKQEYKSLINRGNTHTLYFFSPHKPHPFHTRTSWSYKISSPRLCKGNAVKHFINHLFFFSLSLSVSLSVKLNAPNNVSLLLSETELWIYWNVTSNAKDQCQEREVRYRINSNNWIIYSRTMGNTFNVPFPNARSLYEFQVRVRMSSTCGQSDLWSEWSEPVFWGSMKKINDTETRQQMPVGLMVLCTVGAAVVLIMLTCLLIHSERLRVILVPVVPSPKNLRDLIDSYDGNVEKWLHISKELQDGFKPNFSERPCIVREFRTETHSESESDDCLSVHTAVSSDYQSMQSYSSTSTLRSPTETPSTETTPLNGL